MGKRMDIAESTIKQTNEPSSKSKNTAKTKIKKRKE